MGGRRLILEDLEERTLLTTLSIITHGAQPSAGESDIPAWVVDMATAINERLGSPCDREQITNSRVRRADAIASRDFSAPSNSCQHFLLYDWSDVSNDFGVADSAHVAGILAELVRHRLSTGGKLNLHFIGHSRGAYVNRSAITELNTSMDEPRIGFLQMSSLDPQPLGDDGTLDRPPIVDYLDNYYQTFGLDGAPDFNGESIHGANVNVDLTDVLRQWLGRPTFNHGEVHDWYHWTIDTDDSAISPTYTDSGIVHQQQELHKEHSSNRQTTRNLLYSSSLGFDLDGDGRTDVWGWGIAESIQTDGIPNGLYGLVHTITRSDPNSNSFGDTITITGNRIFISDTRSDVLFASDGAVVYQYDSLSGDVVRRILPPDRQPGFGAALAAWENRLLISSAASGFGSSGRVFLYDTDNGGQLRTFDNPAEPGLFGVDRIGAALAINGRYVLIGDPIGDFPGVGNVGAAYLFDGVNGVLLHTFHSPTPATGFGNQVALVGNKIVIAETHRGVEPFFSQSGQVHIFNADTREYLRSIVTPNADDPDPNCGLFCLGGGRNSNDRFATDITAVGSDILVTAPQGAGFLQGGAAVHLFDGESGELIRTFKHPHPNLDQGFGTAVSAVGDQHVLIAGATGQLFQQENVVFLFDVSSGETVHTFHQPHPTAKTRDFGHAVAGIGSSILISELGFPSFFGSSSSGIVYRFQGPSVTLPGDADGDGTVGFTDFLILSNNFGLQAGATLFDGDFDGNGAVNFSDFLILSNNFGEF